MKLLFLNLTRFGDLLQTQAAIADAYAAGHEVALVCLENFSEVASLLQGVSHIFPLPSSKILALTDAARLLKQSNAQTSWITSLEILKKWKEQVYLSLPADTIINFTPTLSAKLLTSLLAHKNHTAGFCLDDEGFGIYSTWATLFASVAISREASPFNIVDIFRKMISPLTGMAAGNKASRLAMPSKKDRTSMQEHLRLVTPNACEGYVAFQLGASEERRRWPVEFFVAVGEFLWREMHLCPVLLGSKSEKNLVDQYRKKSNHPHISLCGTTTLPELASALCQCNLLVTNDTGTMHLASGLSIPILAFFLATAQPFDTGPYSDNNCCLEPDMPCHPCSFDNKCQHNHACRYAIQPEIVCHLIKNYFAYGYWHKATSSAPLEGARVWESFFSNDGFISLQSLSGHEKEGRTVRLLWQRFFLKKFLDGKNSPITPNDDSIPLLPLGYIQELEKEATLISVLLDLLLQQGKLLSLRPNQALQDKFMTTWSKVHDSFLKSLWFRALAFLWIEETQSQDQGIHELIEIISKYKKFIESLKVSNLCYNQ